MSPEPTVTSAETPLAWPVLSAQERRVLGVLVEKAKTTPDVYPLSMNSLISGCNQKSNRDPIMNLADVEVEEALVNAQKKGLVIRIQGGRVERWRHVLYEAWQLDKVELAILGELLLRGPQTEGELRARASRMEPIEDLESLRRVLQVLAGRRLIAYLTPEGRRGTVLTHGFHAPEELERLRTRHPVEAEGAPADEISKPTLAGKAVLDEPYAEVAELRKVVTDLQTQVSSLNEQVRSIKESLGL